MQNFNWNFSEEKTRLENKLHYIITFCTTLAKLLEYVQFKLFGLVIIMLPGLYCIVAVCPQIFPPLITAPLVAPLSFRISVFSNFAWGQENLTKNIVGRGEDKQDILIMKWMANGPTQTNWMASWLSDWLSEWCTELLTHWLNNWGVLTCFHKVGIVVGFTASNCLFWLNNS